MKISEVLSAIIIRLVIIMPIISSCSSSKDIYKNPYQSETNPSAISGSVYDNQPGLNQQPEWIYAVSKDFIVGYGSGKDIPEAKNAALNDIKSFIIKSLGETGNVVEINFVSNTATGRNNAESQETYLMKNQFETKYKPVINISTDRFEDYYYEKNAYSSKYFIKYRLDASELERIRNEYNASVHRSNLAAQKIHRTIDSLITFTNDLQLESILERYNAISDYYYGNKLDQRDSLKLLRGLQNIQAFFNTVQIRILEHDQGNFIRFGLFNGQILVSTRTKPSIVSTVIIEESLTKQDEIWELRYKTIDGLQSDGNIEISYSLPIGALTSKVTIPKGVLNPAFEIIDKIQLYDIQKNSWNGTVSSLTMRMNINYHNNYPSTINSFELILHNSNSSPTTIHADNLKFNLAPGLNPFAKTIYVDLPMRLFLTRELFCDLIFYYTSDNKLEKFQINDIPLTINN